VLAGRSSSRVLSDAELHDLKRLEKGIVQRMMRVLGRTGPMGGFTLVLFLRWGVGSKVVLEQVQLNCNFRNKFIILLPYGLLVDNNTFLKNVLF